MPYEVLDHTADLRIRVHGNSLKSIFENSVIAISDLILDSSNMKCSIERKIQIKKNNDYDILIELLSDILFYLEADNVIYCKSDLELSNGILNGTLYGASMPPNPEYRHAIKAVTYYGLSIQPEKGYAIIVLDV